MSSPRLWCEDWRYPMFRERAGRAEFVADLVAIHLIPTLQVYLGMVPVYVADATRSRYRVADCRRVRPGQRQPRSQRQRFSSISTNTTRDSVALMTLCAVPAIPLYGDANS